MIEIRLSILGETEDIAELAEAMQGRHSTGVSVDEVIGAISSKMKATLEAEEKPFGVI